SPPARSSPTMSVRAEGSSDRPALGGIVLQARLALMARRFIRHGGRIAVKSDPAFAGQGDEALALRASDQGEIGLAGQLHAPGGEPRSGDQDRNAHLDGLD